MSLAGLPPDELRERAKAAARPSDPAAHWSTLAQLIGGVEDRRLYDEFGFASTRSWAEAELHLSQSDTRDHYALWRLMITGAASAPTPIPFETWLEIPKGRALIVRRAVRAGLDVAAMVQAALAAESEDDLRALVAERLGTDPELPWVTVEFVSPPDFAEVFEAKLMLALAAIGEHPPDLATARALVTKREIRFRCVEVLIAGYSPGDDA